MECAFGTSGEIARCVEIVRDWVVFTKPLIEAGLGLLGVGSVVSLGVLTWLLKRTRRDIERHIKTEDELRQLASKAADAQRTAEDRERRAEEQAKIALDALKRHTAPINENLTLLQAEYDGLRHKLDLMRLSGAADGADFWARKPDLARMPENYQSRLRNSIPVMLFANQKGGVGKTTLSTNLAAYFAAKGERVLLIDLDYQGSATSLMIAQSGTRPTGNFPSMVDMLFQEELNALWAGTAIQKAADNIDYVSCWYPFERTERVLEYAFAIDDSRDDIRYRLARAVLSADVQNTYARVIIDAPPRMTTGFVNGICASTHLFVPTVVDTLSATAVGTFATQFRKLRDAVNPILELSAVIGTMTTRQKVPHTALEIVTRTNTAVRTALSTKKDYLLQDATMVRTSKVPYSTDEGIPYLNTDANTRGMFDVIGKAVAESAPARSP